MLPILYLPSSSKTDFFTHNGVGFLTHCISCKVLERRNEKYELEAEILINDRLADYIVPTAYVKIKPNHVDDPQIFEIFSVSKIGNTIKINAWHIRYQMNANVFVEPFRMSQAKTPEEIWSSIQEFLYYPNDFTFSSTITSSGIVKAAKNSPIRLGEFMLGEEGSMLDTFGGEYYFDNYDVKLKSRRGSRKNVCLKLGTGLSDLQYDIDSFSVFTDIVPFASVPFRKKIPNTSPSQYEAIGDFFIYSEPVATGNTILTYGKGLVYDFSDELKKQYPDIFIGTVDGNVPISSDESNAMSKLDTLVNDFIRRNSNDLNNFTANIKAISQIGTSQIANCNLCDTVKVFYEPFDMEITAEVVSLTYDALYEKTIELELGSVKKNVARLFSNTNFGGW